MSLPPFQSLIDEHWRDVARFAHALAGPVDGDDVAQQAWTNALAAYPALRHSANLRGWLFTITARCATDAHRSRGRRPVPVGEPAEVEAAAPPTTTPRTDAPTDPDHRLWALVRELPERQRIAVALRYIADLDHAAVARHLETTPAASRRLVADALATLREEIPMSTVPNVTPNATPDNSPSSAITDLEAALRRFEPVVTPPTPANSDLSYLVSETPIGRMLFAVRADGTLVTSVFAPDEAVTDAVLRRLATAISPSILRRPRDLDAVRRQFDEYLTGHRTSFDLELDAVLAAPFQRQVLAALPTVGYGTTTTYGELAARIGRPKASRAVGAALGANPLCVVLPCHRVVAGSGALTGYAGGLAAKQHLLDLERHPTG